MHRPFAVGYSTGIYEGQAQQLRQWPSEDKFSCVCGSSAEALLRGRFAEAHVSLKPPQTRCEEPAYATHRSCTRSNGAYLKVCGRAIFAVVFEAIGIKTMSHSSFFLFMFCGGILRNLSVQAGDLEFNPRP